MDAEAKERIVWAVIALVIAVIAGIAGIEVCI